MLLLITYPNNPRECKKAITILLKSGIVSEIHKRNYMKNYQLINKKIEVQQKIGLLIKIDEINLKKFNEIAKKINLPNAENPIILEK
ncbi:MAG TPA: hypothetical protein PKC14_01515 [Candidatus Absconditabacterales bacterium]|nr:hypothetical protein [Candidatus Absconditabacterales bacterium]